MMIELKIWLLPIHIFFVNLTQITFRAVSNINKIRIFFKKNRNINKLNILYKIIPIINSTIICPPTQPKSVRLPNAKIVNNTLKIKKNTNCLCHWIKIIFSMTPMNRIKLFKKIIINIANPPTTLNQMM